MTKPVMSSIMNELGPILLGYGGFAELIDGLETSPRELTEKSCRKLGGVSSQPIGVEYRAYSNPPYTWVTTPIGYITRSDDHDYIHTGRNRCVSNKAISHEGWGSRV